MTNVGVLTGELRDEEADEEPDDEESLTSEAIPPGVEVYEINGPLFFGAAYKFEAVMNVIEGTPAVWVLRMRNVPAIDATGLHALEESARHLRRNGGHLLIAEIHAQSLVALEKSGIDKVIGRENIFGTLDEALARARELTGRNIER